MIRTSWWILNNEKIVLIEYIEKYQFLSKKWSGCSIDKMKKQPGFKGLVWRDYSFLPFLQEAHIAKTAYSSHPLLFLLLEYLGVGEVNADTTKAIQKLKWKIFEEKADYVIYQLIQVAEWSKNGLYQFFLYKVSLYLT